MHIEIGDLVVSSRNNSGKIGIVVKKSSINSAAMSQHAKNILSGLFVYYVYFSNEGFLGPFYSNELKLTQHLN